MLAEKTNKVHSVSGSQTKTTQQQCQPSDLQHLFLVIQQFSSQLNLMVSQQQQQQQKHSDIGVRGSNMDNKQEQPSYSEQQQQQLPCPVNASRYPSLASSHSNFCSNAVCSCSKTNNNSNEHHCHSTRLSPSLSTLFPLQHHYTPTCLHDTLYQNYHHHTPPLPYGYDTCALSMMCCCHHPSSHQCTTTNTALSPHQMNGTTSLLAPIGHTALEHRSHQHHRNTMPMTMHNTPIDPCPPPTTPPKFKSMTDPLPPIPNDDDDKAMMDSQDDPPLDTGRASSSSCTAAASPIPQPSTIADNVSHRLSWTDLYRQDILAKQDTLISSYNHLDSIHITDSNTKKKESKARSNHSHLRGWWAHGKYKWNQLRKKSLAPLFVSG